MNDFFIHYFFMLIEWFYKNKSYLFFSFIQLHKISLDNIKVIWYTILTK